MGLETLSRPHFSGKQVYMGSRPFKPLLQPKVNSMLAGSLMPWHEPFKQQVEELRARGEHLDQHIQSLERLMPYLAMVVVQDALELAEEAPENPVHKMLLQHPIFK